MKLRAATLVAVGPRAWQGLHPAGGGRPAPAMVEALTDGKLVYRVAGGTRVRELGRHVFRDEGRLLAPDAIAVRFLDGPHSGRIGYVPPGAARDDAGGMGPASAGKDGEDSAIDEPDPPPADAAKSKGEMPAPPVVPLPGKRRS